jgi:hypothetical protein
MVSNAMKCPCCGENMVPGYVMVMGGSALRWYDQDEKQHKILGSLGGQFIVDANITHRYLPAHRCNGCNRFLISMDGEGGGYDQASIDKAR